MKPYYEHGGITIYCGDCRELIAGLSCDLLLTDPQYQLANGAKAALRNAASGRDRQLLGGTITSAHDWGELKGDHEPFDPACLLHFPRIILWGAIHYANRLPSSTSWLIWDKRCGIPSDDNADAEIAWSNLGGPVRIHRQLWKGIVRQGIENIAIQGEKLHPFQKPLDLMLWCIAQAKLSPGSLILDCYCGSGSTLLAAKQLGHRAIGIEIEERYCETSAMRLSQEVLDFGKAAQAVAS